MRVLLVALLMSGSAVQAQRDARILVTVVDQSGAVIPNATVTVTSLADPKTPIPPSSTATNGIATLQGLALGHYSIQAEFPGFEPRVLKDIQLRPGDNKQTMALALQGLQDSVTVSRDAREAASDRRTTFGSAMTREQIEALSDDPAEMAQQLREIGGSDAIIRVDSFEGGQLPPKSAIKSIHITRDAFAAENHNINSFFIDIITQPGMGPLRTNMSMRLRDGSLSGKNQLAAAKGPERTQNYNGGLSGSLIKQRASFSVNVNTATQFETPVFYLRDANGSLVNTLGPRRPSDNMFVYGLFDYALTRDQTLRVNYSRSQSQSHNLGIGGYDSAERAYSNEDHSNQLRIQEAGPLGRRFFINTRATLGWSDTENSSVFDGPTIRIIDVATTGGQQVAGGNRRKTINLFSDLDYVRGIHSFRTGLQLDGGSYHSDDAANYLGTFTFVSRDAFLAGAPRSFTRRVGNPVIDYNNYQAGVYLQDDIRVRRNLTFSPGIRYELQTHLSDVNNFGPRFGVTWSPGKAGTTTLRASAGVFYDWLSSNIYEQTLRVDGFRQRELNIINPSYPVANEGDGISSPTNRYLLADDLQMQRSTRLSVGIDRAVTKGLRINASYAHISGDRLLRGQNLNTPINGVRPDPLFGNVVQVIDDAESRQNTLSIGGTMNFNTATPGPAMLNGGAIMIMSGGPSPANGQRWNWRRFSLFGNASIGSSRNNTEGAFSIPTTGSIADDWGPANFDIRSRMNLSINSSQLRNFNANINVNMATASPYTIRTGTDDNGDLLFTDRPAGVGRNTLRASGQWTISGYFNYGWVFGKPVERAGGINLRSDGGAIAVSQAAAQSSGRYRLSLNINVQNLTNHGNLTGYSGTLTSVNFGKPTTVLGTRKVDIGLGLSF